MARILIFLELISGTETDFSKIKKKGLLNKPSSRNVTEMGPGWLRSVRRKEAQLVVVDQVLGEGRFLSRRISDTISFPLFSRLHCLWRKENQGTDGYLGVF